jgi:hypothetical protein
MIIVFPKMKLFPRKVRREVVDCMRMLMKLAREKVSQVSL